jgi:hypothetical protein
MFGLPLGSTLALASVLGLPGLAYGLYWIDRQRGSGHVTVWGRPAESPTRAPDPSPPASEGP